MVTGVLLLGKEDRIAELIPTAKASFQVLEGTKIRKNEQLSKPLLATFELFEEYMKVWNPEREMEYGLFRVPIPEFSESAYIGHYTVIGENCVVGDHTIIKSHVTIDDQVEIGKSCFIDSHVMLTGEAKIGDRVRIHSNTVIGGEGFGFAPYQGKWHRIVQLGSVIIGNDVRIGSNCSVDRGALDDTILENGVIIDNLVQIAHNVKVGANTAIAAKCGVAGSTTIGKNCVLAGGVGVVGHINIVDNVTITGMSMVTNNISEAGKYSSGTGLLTNSQWKRTVVRLRQLADVPLTQLTKKIDHMQSQIESLESTLKLRK